MMKAFIVMKHIVSIEYLGCNRIKKGNRLIIADITCLACKLATTKGERKQ